MSPLSPLNQAQLDSCRFVFEAIAQKLAVHQLRLAATSPMTARPRVLVGEAMKGHFNPRQKIDEEFNNIANYLPVPRAKLEQENNQLYVRFAIFLRMPTCYYTSYS